jgi:hypothetical protein
VKPHLQKLSLPSVCMDGSLIRQLPFVLFLLLVTALLPGILLPVYAADGQSVANNTPAYVSSATNLGAVDPSQAIEVSI